MANGKKVLILGNGFDLAHGLPTRYSDFLSFCYHFRFIYTFHRKTEDEFKFRVLSMYEKELYDIPLLKDAHDALKNSIFALYKSREQKDSGCTEFSTNSYDYFIPSNSRFDELYGCIANNIWFNYLRDLQKERLIRGENWIDFESEIAEIVRYLETKYPNMKVLYSDVANGLIHGDAKDNYSQSKLNYFYEACDKRIPVHRTTNQIDIKSETITDLRDTLLGDLKDLTRALELYMTEIVEDMSLPNKIVAIEKINPDYVVTFNYTNTYEKLYCRGSEIDTKRYVCHIHGNADKKRKADECNLVLGIDEYLRGDDRYSHTEYSSFRKFTQRILNKNSVQYSKWANEVRNSYSSNGENWSGEKKPEINYPDSVSEIWIYGHSMDITDKDVLARFIDTDASAIHVFARNRAEEGTLLSHVLKYISQETLVRKSTTLPPRFEFIRI